ncbi:MAG: hypothetical protein HW416_3109 [Chloroflexi bacterium]|nr:hypothetical protein [Chloroflexota bacterium]
MDLFTATLSLRVLFGSQRVVLIPQEPAGVVEHLLGILVAEYPYQAYQLFPYSHRSASR